jgi:mannose-1-phosphate guanylyltransferase
MIAKLVSMSELGALLFAGGVGQRLWPLSRRNTPKQFAPLPLLGSRSSFQLAVDRLQTIISPERIYVGTNRQYAGVLDEQVPDIPARNFIFEPTRRDVAAAVALAFFSLEKDGVRGPFVFQWTDNFVKNPDRLLEAIEVGRKLIVEKPERLVFVGERPRFANENLGWIELGDELGKLDGTSYYGFRSWRYRPPKPECEQMFASGRYVWNSGYFVTSVEFMCAAFRSLTPELAAQIEEIVSYRGTPQERQKLEELYPKVLSLHFDEAILVRLGTDQAVMLSVDLGWSDPGSLYSLKEAAQASPESSVIHGNVVDLKTRDSLLYNANPDKVLAVMGLDGIIVVDTPDALLVIHKDAVRHIGELLEKLGANGYNKLL